jgi:hypothetical protein
MESMISSVAAAILILQMARPLFSKQSSPCNIACARTHRRAATGSI